MRRSVRRCGGAPLHAAALGSRAVPLRESPATCFVPGVPSRNKHLHATGQTALQTFRPEFPGDWVDVDFVMHARSQTLILSWRSWHNVSRG